MDFADAADPAFIDAERLYLVLEGVAAAPNLYACATEKFPERSEEAASGFDEPAFELLVLQELVVVPPELRNQIDRFRHLHREGDRTRLELDRVYRRIKATFLELRKADKALEATGSVGTLLKSMTQKWEDRTRRDTLQGELNELTFTRRRLESELEKAGNLFKDLLDRIYREPALRESVWYQDMPVGLSSAGRYLLEYLQEMNPEHFRGRTLAEILEIGPALA